MTYWLERFKQLEKEIIRHPLLEIIESHYNPPISEAKVSLVEEQLGFEITESMRTFFLEVNGLQLSWGFKQNIPTSDIKSIINQYDDYRLYLGEEKDNLKSPIGCINLLSLENCMLDNHRELFFDDSAEGDWDVEFINQTYQGNSLGQKLRPWDLFSEYECISFFINKEEKKIPIILLGDYYIVWNSSRLIDFNTYLDVVLHTKGVIEARNKILSKYRGDKESLITFDIKALKNLTPKLFS